VVGFQNREIFLLEVPVLGFSTVECEEDTKHEVSSAYSSVTDPVVTKLAARHTFLINPERVIVREFLDVNPSKHSQEVLAALTQLQQSAAAK